LSPVLRTPTASAMVVRGSPLILRPHFLRFWLIWQSFAVLFLLVASSHLAIGVPLWSLDSPRLVQVAGLGVVHLAFAAILAVSIRRGKKPGPLSALVVAALALTPYFLFLLVAMPIYSRAVLLAGTVLFLLLGLTPFILSTSPRSFAILPGLAAILVVGIGLVGLQGPEDAPDLEPAISPPPPEVESSARVDKEIISSVFHWIQVSYHEQPLPPVRGGGLASLGPDYLLVAGDGTFRRLRFVADSLHADALDLRAPLNRDAFLHDVGGSVDPDFFRVSGLLIRKWADSKRVVVSHHHWHADRRCFALRFSETTMPDLESAVEGSGSGEWQILYETQPCLRLKDSGNPFAGHQAGGRMVVLPDDNILVTVGDHEFDGVNSEEILSQSLDNDYGKTLIIPPSGGEAEVFTLGHRNPQGLFVGSTNEIWLTEHGPEGGDLLTLLVRGANYGWPYHTFGTSYGDVRWPLQGSAPSELSVRYADFAWVPSIGVSNLIVVEGEEFPQWRGDLLVSSLATRSLYRLRRHGDRIVYAERILLDHRVRDLVEGADGRIVIWTDEGLVLTLSRAEGREGEILVQSCLQCHTLEPGAHGIAPSLAGIVGAPIGSQAGFAYSDALSSLAGIWTEANLDRFLADPTGFAPGNRMAVPGVQEHWARRSIIEYLQTLAVPEP
jgi:aldose sugar dehydrogenase